MPGIEPRLCAYQGNAVPLSCSPSLCLIGRVPEYSCHGRHGSCLNFLLLPFHLHTHIHTTQHTQTHAHMHARTLAHTQYTTHRHTCTQRTYACTHTRTYACKLACAHIHTHLEVKFKYNNKKVIRHLHDLKGKMVVSISFLELSKMVQESFWALKMLYMLN